MAIQSPVSGATRQFLTLELHSHIKLSSTLAVYPQVPTGFGPWVFICLCQIFRQCERMKLRAAFYVDGFNLYHSIDNLKKPHLLWLSLRSLAEELIPSRDETVASISYFSAIAFHRNTTSISKHRAYIAALKATGVECVLGRFKDQHRTCRKCGNAWKHPEEKETDVNIAVRMVADGFQDLFDVCYLISADTDLIPPLRLIRATLPTKTIVAVSPPGRPHGQEIRALAHRSMKLNADQLGRCRLPQSLPGTKGKLIPRPADYDPPA